MTIFKFRLMTSFFRSFTPYKLFRVYVSGRPIPDLDHWVDLVS